MEQVTRKQLHDIMKMAWGLGYLAAVEDCKAPLPCTTLELVTRAEEFARHKDQEAEVKLA